MVWFLAIIGLTGAELKEELNTDFSRLFLWMAQTKTLNNQIYQLIYSGCMKVFKREVLRYPTLDTVLMVEEAAKKSKGDLTTRELWFSLPRKSMWQTYMATLDYLEYSGKILIDKEKHVIWIWAPKKITSLARRGLVHEKAGS
jgi:hypothetical protein